MRADREPRRELQAEDVHGQGLIGGQYTGVCLSKCLKFGFFQQLGISQGDCDNVHNCAPCNNPLTGQPTGAPGCPAT